jgi:hypothetical protein
MGSLLTPLAAVDNDFGVADRLYPERQPCRRIKLHFTQQERQESVAALGFGCSLLQAMPTKNGG